MSTLIVFYIRWWRVFTHNAIVGLHSSSVLVKRKSGTGSVQLEIVHRKLYTLVVYHFSQLTFCYCNSNWAQVTHGCADSNFESFTNTVRIVGHAQASTTQRANFDNVRELFI